MYILLDLGQHPWVDQDLLLALSSGINSLDAWSTVGNARDQTMLGCMQGKKCLTHCDISTALLLHTVRGQIPKGASSV